MKVKIADIRNWEPRRGHGSISNLKASISAVGLISPLAIDQDGNLLAGRRRYQAIKELGWTEVEVTTLPVDGDKLKAYRVAIDENLHRKPLTRAENRSTMAGYNEMKQELEGRADRYSHPKATSHSDNGWTLQKTADDLGVSYGAVSEAVTAEEYVKEHPELAPMGTREVLAEKRKEERAQALAQAELSVVGLRLGDFRDLMPEIADNSIDLILTDPPYGKDFLPLWADLASQGARVLKPGGFLIAYCGQNYLPQVLNYLSGHLDYYWLGMLYHKGETAQRFEVNMWNRAKLILFFNKPPRVPQTAWLEDVIESPKADKGYHKWGQSVEPFRKLVECFSLPGQVLLDPLAGGGAVVEACLSLKRGIIAMEKDEQVYQSLRRRFSFDNNKKEI